jgi:hypothetical protein
MYYMVGVIIPDQRTGVARVVIYVVVVRFMAAHHDMCLPHPLRPPPSPHVP